MPSTVPAWVAINSSTGMLNVTAPTVPADTNFYFYIDSNAAGVSKPIKKLIKITILDCKASNCSKCNSTNSSVCDVCISGYALSSGNCTLLSANTTTETAKKLSTTTASVAVAIMGLSALTGAINLISFATLWMIINQLQIFKAVLFLRFALILKLLS